MEETYTTEQLKELAGKLTKRLRPGDVLALYGELGSGKTTFTRYLVDSLGFGSRVQSPTFIIVRNYLKKEGLIKRINHVDLYRLDNINEALDIGINEMIEEKDSITVIEWPGIFEEMLPESTIRVHFNYVNEDKRKVRIENYV